jgi:ABC-type dipeptide/oligopeptide/nickel transport system ATPase component
MSKRERRAFRAHDVGMVFQDPFSSLNPVRRVGSQVAETLRANRGMSRAQARIAAIGLLEDVGLPNPSTLVKKYPHELSGGMRQRVMIALATSANPRLLLADEPTTALDVLTQKQVLELLTTMREHREMAMIIVSHDFGVIAQMCDRVMVMNDGEIVETGGVAQVYDSPSHPYTRSLLAAVPTFDAVQDRLSGDDTPSPSPATP